MRGRNNHREEKRKRIAAKEQSAHLEGPLPRAGKKKEIESTSTTRRNGGGGEGTLSPKRVSSLKISRQSGKEGGKEAVSEGKR